LIWIKYIAYSLKNSPHYFVIYWNFALRTILLILRLSSLLVQFTKWKTRYIRYIISLNSWKKSHHHFTVAKFKISISKMMIPWHLQKYYAISMLMIVSLWIGHSALYSRRSSTIQADTLWLLPPCIQIQNIIFHWWFHLPGSANSFNTFLLKSNLNSGYTSHRLLIRLQWRLQLNFSEDYMHF
jgi:hypothetical protein